MSSKALWFNYLDTQVRSPPCVKVSAFFLSEHLVIVYWKQQQPCLRFDFNQSWKIFKIFSLCDDTVNIYRWDFFFGFIFGLILGQIKKSTEDI